MKTPKEERVSEIKRTIKTFKGDLKKYTKAEIAECLISEISWLMRELAKAQKPSA